MRSFGFVISGFLFFLYLGYLSEAPQAKQERLIPEHVHILNLDELKTSTQSRSPAQFSKWVISSNRVQLVSRAAGRKITAVKNKTNGFTATLFESSGAITTDFIDLADGLNELELTFKTGKALEVSPIWLEVK